MPLRTHADSLTETDGLRRCILARTSPFATSAFLGMCGSVPRSCLPIPINPPSWDATFGHVVDAVPQATVNAFDFLGRPPSVPFWRAALAFASLETVA